MQPTIEQNTQQQKQLATASMLQQLGIDSRFSTMLQNVLKSPGTFFNPLGLGQNAISESTSGTSTSSTIVPDASIIKDSDFRIHSSSESREQSGSAKRARLAQDAPDEGYCVLLLILI